MKLMKAFAVLIVIAIASGALKLWYDTVLVGNYFASSGVFLAVMAVFAPFVVAALASVAIRSIVKLDPSDFN